ncbi:MAG: FAD-dependent oxidoreductase [Dehalococcoidia bacterium]|nr:FAD-dependent oxidoreductase [Dehalococcoidia bacterium]
MADASFDVVIVGGGNKGLILGMYLARYGGMSVGIFERRHEAGGGWSTDEGAAPGFLADYHCAGVGYVYNLTTQLDFPEWRELGGGLTNPKIACGGIFKEDDSCVALYSKSADPNWELTAKSIAQFSGRDAETWIRLENLYRDVMSPYFLEFLLNPPPPVGEPDAMDKLLKDPKAGIDPSWIFKTPLEVLSETFESDAFIAFLIKQVYSGIVAAADSSGMGLHVLLAALGLPYTRGVVGGTHSWAHAAVKIFLGDSGKIFNKREVEKVLIEDSRAKGVRLADGSEIEAKKLVVSTLDPYNLCFKLIGKEHFNWQTLRKVERLERRETCITWYTWALHEPPHYIAARENPDIDSTAMLDITSKDPEMTSRLKAMRQAGIMPRGDDLDLMFLQHNCVDKTRAPEGKCAILSEQFVLPANALSEKEWLEFKKVHAEDTIKEWGKHAPNMTWDNVIGYVPLTPYDCCHLPNMAPTGNWAIIDDGIPSQYGRHRPVPELARHKTPIQNLYATGSAWPPYGDGASWQGYNCYKIIAEDFGLRKPWEEQGRLW